MNENYDSNYDYEKEEKKQRARELLEGLQYVQQDDAQRMEQAIVNEEFQKIREEYGLTPAEEAKIQQALMQNVPLQAKAIRKAVRKRAETILRGLAPKGSINKKLKDGPSFRSPEKTDIREKSSSSKVMEAARQRRKEKGYLHADEQVEIIDALLGDFLKR